MQAALLCAPMERNREREANSCPFDKTRRIGYDYARWDSGCPRMDSVAEHRNRGAIPRRTRRRNGRGAFLAATGRVPGKAKRTVCMPEPEDLPGMAVLPPRVLGAPHRRGRGNPAGFPARTVLPERGGSPFFRQALVKRRAPERCTQLREPSLKSKLF